MCKLFCSFTSPLFSSCKLAFVFFFKVNVALVIFSSAFLGIAIHLFRERIEGRKNAAASTDSGLASNSDIADDSAGDGKE